MRTMSDFLADAFPRLASRLPKIRLADLPTPVEQGNLQLRGHHYPLAIKRDDLTASLCGGNKVRKLEYLFQKARQCGARRIATFGTVASNHALATALYANSLDYECTCLLSHQVQTPHAAQALQLHLRLGTELVHFGGDRRHRIETLRTSLWNRGCYLIPPGGSNWLGAVGFVNAGLELAAQIRAGNAPAPARLYVANGTMATAVGLTLGMALAGLQTEVHAVQVTADFVSSPDRMQRLLDKTVTLLARLDPAIPHDLARRARYVFRTGFRGAGYARTDAATESAILIAREQLGLALEATYTGKAMAALLADLGTAGGDVLFWNTYNSRPLPVDGAESAAAATLPEEFRRYCD